MQSKKKGILIFDETKSNFICTYKKLVLFLPRFVRKSSVY